MTVSTDFRRLPPHLLQFIFKHDEMNIYVCFLYNKMFNDIDGISRHLL